MALTLSNHFSSPITLDEYIEIVNKEVDPDDEASIIESGKYLAQLGANRTFLIERLNNALVDVDQYGIPFVSMQTMMLGGTKSNKLRVRANFWTPIRTKGKAAEEEASTLSYGIAHDHNFPFVTVGYMGSGYQTDIYEYDRDSIVGIPGETVDLRYLGREQLTEGRVMYFRPCVDVHTQLPPEAISVSINLLADDAQRNEPQYFFDTNAKKIINNVESVDTVRHHFLQMAATIGDDNTTDILQYMSTRHFCPRVRAEALVSVASKTSEANIDRFMAIAERDTSPFVRYYVRKFIESHQ